MLLDAGQNLSDKFYSVWVALSSNFCTLCSFIYAWWKSVKVYWIRKVHGCVSTYTLSLSLSERTDEIKLCFRVTGRSWTWICTSCSLFKTCSEELVLQPTVLDNHSHIEFFSALFVNLISILETKGHIIDSSTVLPLVLQSQQMSIKLN